MKLVVNPAQRYAKMRAHTATHLLHAQLAKIFPTTKQEWSLVDSDLLRFDFAAERLLTPLELAIIEKRINQMIYMAGDVVTEEMSIDAAAKLWAKMFFEDKYGDTVRVVQVKNLSLPEELKQDDTEEYFTSFGDFLSLELCGGTHVANTKDIGCFSLISQEAVASGVKRITAVTWPRVSEKIAEVQGILDIAVNKLGIKTATQLQDKLDKTLREYEEMKSSMESLESVSIRAILIGTDFASGKNLDKVFLLPAHLNFKNVLACAKWVFDKENILVYNKEWNFLVITKQGVSAKDTAIKLWLKWWGNEQIVQGRDEKVLELFK